jgi:hypothetical protein
MSRKPKFAVVFWPVVVIAIVGAFVGIRPLSDVKDSAANFISGFGTTTTATVTNPPTGSKTSPPPPITAPQPITIPKPITPPPITIPEPKLKDPTWNQLLEFLRTDNTDAHPYIYPTFVCASFAKMLQDNAHKTGWRCAIVHVELSGYPDWYGYGIPSNTGHSCNAFNTVDRGLVYIDDTRTAGIGPANQDNIVSIQLGKQYIPKALFPTPGWHSTSLSMGIVVGVSDPQW